MWVRLRGGSGLGDALYLRPIAEHLLSRGDKVTALTAYREVFSGLDVTVEPFGRERVNIVAHYTHGKMRQESNQWQDICTSARLSVPMRMVWHTRNTPLVQSVRTLAAGRKIILAHAGREPMGRRDGFGNEMLPKQSAVDDALGALKSAFIIEIGAGPQTYAVRSNLCLLDKTTVPDLFDLVSICAGVVAQCSFCVPLAELFDKPALFVWAARGLDSRQQFIRMTTPRKVLSKPSSTFVIDDYTTQQIQEAARALC